MLSKYVAIFLWSFLSGIVLAHSLEVSGVIVCSGIIIGLLCLGLSAGFNIHSNLLKSICCICLGVSCGIMIWTNSLQENQFEHLVGNSVNTQGVVMGWPNLTASGNQSVLIKPDGFSQSLRASLRVPINFHPNDRVWIRGVIKQSENFSGFNYVAYLQKSNVFAELDKPRVIIIQVSKGSRLSFLDSLRQWVIRTSGAKLDQTSSGLVLGMIIGYGDTVPKTLATAFQKTGLTHILVASGFNLTILVSSAGFLAWILGRRWSDITSLSIVWLFVALIGGAGSVVRAAIMVSLILLARSVGRIPTSYFTLLMAVAVMVSLNPFQLFYDIGFQLSVGATIGVLEANKLRVYLQKDGWLTELLWPTSGAIIFTAPIISYYFGTFSLIAPVANLLVLPAVPIVMLLGSLSLLPVVSLFTVPITELIVKFQETVTVYLANWQYSSLSIKATLSFAIGYYVILFLLREVFYFRGRSKKQKTGFEQTIKLC